MDLTCPGHPNTKWGLCAKNDTGNVQIPNVYFPWAVGGQVSVTGALRFAPCTAFPVLGEREAATPGRLREGTAVSPGPAPPPSTTPSTNRRLNRLPAPNGRRASTKRCHPPAPPRPVWQRSLLTPPDPRDWDQGVRPRRRRKAGALQASPGPRARPDPCSARARTPVPSCPLSPGPLQPPRRQPAGAPFSAPGSRLECGPPRLRAPQPRRPAAPSPAGPHLLRRGPAPAGPLAGPLASTARRVPRARAAERAPPTPRSDSRRTRPSRRLRQSRPRHAGGAEPGRPAPRRGASSRDPCAGGAAGAAAGGPGPQPFRSLPPRLPSPSPPLSARRAPHAAARVQLERRPRASAGPGARWTAAPPPLAGLPAASCRGHLPWATERPITGVLKVRSILSILYFKLFL